MKVFKKKADLAGELIRCSGTTGFVPTMGALHEGHISLVKRCRKECDTVVVSIFVNPTQFNDQNDLVKYPRTPEADLALLEKAGVDCVFMPEVDEIYPEKDTRVFGFGELEQVMEGEHRPGHFNGVAQVVSRLFDIVKPDKAYFGEKDFQQLAIIRKMAEQLGLSLEIVGCPIERGADGLALSSRNARLNAKQREEAPMIYKTLKDAVGLKAEMNVNQLEKWISDKINECPELKTEYISIADAATLQPVDSWDKTREERVFAAVWAGDVRLIDNIEF